MGCGSGRTRWWPRSWLGAARTSPRAVVGVRALGFLLALFLAGFAPRPAIADSPQVNFQADPRRGGVPLTVHFTDTSDGTIVAYRWDFGDGATSSARHPTHTYASAGKFDVTLSVMDDQGRDDAKTQ